MADEESTEVLSTGDLCRMFKVNRVTVNDWVAAEKLPEFKTLGGHLRFRRGELARFLKERGVPLPPELKSAVTRILIVDDEPSILNTLSRRIRARHPAAVVDTADNGVDAILKIGAKFPDILILDLIMPKMDGMEVIRRLHANPHAADIKILAMSGYTRDAAEVLKAGAHAFFRKGSDLADLLAALAAAMAPGVKA